MEATGSSLKRPRELEQNEQDQISPRVDEMWNSEANKRICFGSIVSVKARLCSPAPPSRHDHGRPKDSAQPVDVVQEGDYFALEYNGTKIARLNKGLCKHLHALVIRRQVYIRGYVPNQHWATVVQHNDRSRSTIIPLEINIYGTAGDFGEVGSILSNSGIFLQLPHYGLEGVDYHNPHLLQIEGYSEMSTASPSPATEDLATTPGQSAEGEAQVNDSIDSILDSLSHHVNPHDIPVDHRIKTVLLDHQKEAIDFVHRRETGQIHSKLSLWKYNDQDTDEPFYQHVFSGAKRPQEDDAQAGIIADEMGLGKSLVMLSTIAGSLERAQEFVATENQLLLTQPARKYPSKATLILAPSSLLIDSWVDEIYTHTYSGGLSFHKHLGVGRHAEADRLHQKEIVFTTYATAAADFSRGKSVLAKISWFRIVLDEAHDIRNRSTKQFQAVACLSAQHRWCLTGTPIQNTLEDLGALVSFLKVPILEKPPAFRKFITNPTASDLKASFQNLRTLLQAICLRRTKEILNLPQPNTRIRKLPLTACEQAAYNELLLQCRTDIDMVVSRRRKGYVNSTMLESLLKLRLFCNNGNAAPVPHLGLNDLPADSDEALAYLEQHDWNICAYCSGPVYCINNEPGTDGGKFVSSCWHLVCHTCMAHQHTEESRCPICASGGKSNFPASPPSGPSLKSSAESENSRPPNPGHYPSKLLALLSDIRQDLTNKSIVFSCWKKTLFLAGELLDHSGIPFAIIEGSLPLTERIKVLNNFRAPDGPNVLLMTLGTGAVGQVSSVYSSSQTIQNLLTIPRLNLAIASRVFLLEPQWNPSIESQAIGRALRLGQTAPVVIFRYIMMGTVEESSVLDRQKKKLQLATSGFGKVSSLASEKHPLLLDFFGVDPASLK